MEEFNDGSWSKCTICNAAYWRRAKYTYQDVCSDCGTAIAKERKWTDWDLHPERIYCRDIYELLEYFESRFPKLSAELLGVDMDPDHVYGMGYRGEHDEE